MKVYLIHGFAEAFDKLTGAITYLRDHYDIVAYEREYPIEETDTIMDTLTMIGGKGQTEWTFRAIDGERYTIVERVVQQEPYMGEKPNTGYNTCIERQLQGNVMSNSNSYIGHELDWTDWTVPEDLPIGEPIVWKSVDGDLMFGKVLQVSNGVMCVVDNAFHFDRKDQLEGAQWASLAFVFKTE